MNFNKILQASYKNGNTKDCKFVKQFWEWISIICNKQMVRYSHWIKRGSFTWKSNQILTSSLESSLCDYSDAYVLVTGNIAVAGGDDNAKVSFKNCAPFRKCRTEINETFIDEAEHINIAMPMYSLIKYSDNYSDTSGNLWYLK